MQGTDEDEYSRSLEANYNPDRLKGECWAQNDLIYAHTLHSPDSCVPRVKHASACTCLHVPSAAGSGMPRVSSTLEIIGRKDKRAVHSSDYVVVAPHRAVVDAYMSSFNLSKRSNTTTWERKATLQCTAGIESNRY
jgi:hypothetical protein